MKLLFSFRLVGLMGVSLLLAASALAQAPVPTPHPLVSSQESIFSNKGEANLSAVENEAASQKTAAPFYKSNGVETRSYAGYFKAASDTSKLALLSDDGTSVWIDGEQVLNRAGQGQGFDQAGAVTFYPLSKTFAKDRIYFLELQYTNTTHTSDTDVDGLSLWAYDGGGTIVSAPEPLKFDFSFGKTELCAGGLETDPHRTYVTITVKNADDTPAKNKELSLSVDTTLPGKSTPLSASDEDADLRAKLSLTTATTDNQGKVQGSLMLVSSQQIGATIVVKASVGEDSGESASISTVDATGKMSIDADELYADGQSQAKVYLVLNHGSSSVAAHNVRFYIAAVEDEKGQTVNPDENGDFPGYGSIVTTEGTSDDQGIAYGTYTAGTLAGLITFGSEDTSVVTNELTIVQNPRVAGFSWASYQPRTLLAAGSKTRKGTKRQKKAGPKPLGKVNMNLVYVQGTQANGSIKTTTTLNQSNVESVLNTVYAEARIEFRVKKTLLYSLDPDMAYVESKPGYINMKYKAAIENDHLGDLKTGEHAGISAFFVAHVSDSSSANVSGEAVSIPSHAFFQQDGSGSKAGAVLAHETGHCLNLRHIDNDPANTVTDVPASEYTSNLMISNAGGYGGRKLTPQQNNIALHQVQSYPTDYFRTD